MDLNKADIIGLIESLPTPERREKTFLEKIKISQRETIMANIFAYYLNPREEHGLGNLFLKSLLECYFSERAKSDKVYHDISQKLKDINFDSVNVWTEVPTKENNRIDILVESRQFVILIEFKINHILNNPLDDYVSFIEAEYSEIPKENRCYIILSPNRKEPEGRAKECDKDIFKQFKQVILHHFINRVEDNIKDGGDSFPDVKNPQYHYYHDFVTTIKNRRRKIDMLENYLKLVAENLDNNEKLKSIYDNLHVIKEEITAKVSDLKQQLTGFNWIASKENDLFSVVERKKFAYTLKVRLTLAGWSIECWIDGQEQKTIRENYGYKTLVEDVVEKVVEFERKRDEFIC